MPLIEWFTEPFALGFQQRALVGGILAGLMCSIVGTWLVLRGMAFFGDAFTHGVVPGIAAAVAFNFSPLLGAAIAAAVMLLLIETVRRHSTPQRGHRHRPALRGHARPGRGDHLEGGQLHRQPHLDPVRRRPGRDPRGHRLAAGPGRRGDRRLDPALPSAAGAVVQRAEGLPAGDAPADGARRPAGADRRPPSSAASRRSAPCWSSPCWSGPRPRRRWWRGRSPG